MNNILSIYALEAALKRKGWTMKKLADEYDKKYPDKKTDRAAKTIYPTLLKWNSGKGNPTLNRLIRISDLLEVDIDFLLGRISEFTHAAQYIHDTTGLSHDAVEAILHLNEANIESLNALLEDDSFEEVLSYIANYRSTFSKAEYQNALQDFQGTVPSLISDIASNTPEADPENGLKRTIADLQLQLASVKPDQLEFKIDSCFQEVISHIKKKSQDAYKKD